VVNARVTRLVSAGIRNRGVWEAAPISPGHVAARNLHSAIFWANHRDQNARRSGKEWRRFRAASTRVWVGIEKRATGQLPKDEDRKNDEIKFSQLLFVDLRGKDVELFPVFLMTLDRLAVAEDIMQQVRGVRRRDSASRKMTTDVEVGGIFSLLDGLVLVLGPVAMPPAVRAALSFKPAVGRFEILRGPGQYFAPPPKVRLLPPRVFAWPGDRLPRFLRAHGQFRRAPVGNRVRLPASSAVRASRSGGGGACACRAESCLSNSRSGRIIGL